MTVWMFVWMMRWRVPAESPDSMTDADVGNYLKMNQSLHLPPPLLSFQGYGTSASEWHVWIWYVDLHISHQKAFCVFCKAILFAPMGLWTKLYIIPTMYGCWDIVGILLIACRYSWVTCFPLELAMWSYISAIFYGQMNNDRIQHWFNTQMGPIIDSSHAANTC